MKWDEMSPRERDALVADKVMGRDMSTHDEHSFEPLIDTGVPAEFSDAAKCCSHCGVVWFPGNPEPNKPCEAFWSHYSTDIAAAWEVVEELDQWVEVMWLAGAKRWRVRTQGGTEMNIHKGEALTAPEAICRAALRARGVEP